MAGKRILFFGRNPAMMSLIDRQLSAAGMEAEGFMDEELLAEELRKDGVRILVVGGGVEDAPRERLRSLCAEQDILIFEHFGGPTALIENIESVMG